MKRFRFSIAGLMAMILLLAIGMAALRDPTTLWASALFTAAVILCTASFLGAMAHRGVLRFSWAGIAVFGWVYLIISLGPWPGNLVGLPPLLPSHLMDRFQAYIVSDGRTSYMIEERFDTDFKNMKTNRIIEGAGPPQPGGFKTVDMTIYQQIGHSLGAMLFGIMGAFAGRFFAVRRERSANDA